MVPTSSCWQIALNRRLLTHVTLPTHSFGIDVAGGTACVAVQSRGVAVLDVSDPDHISLVGIMLRGAHRGRRHLGRLTLWAPTIAGSTWWTSRRSPSFPDLTTSRCRLIPGPSSARRTSRSSPMTCAGLTVVDVHDPHQLAISRFRQRARDVRSPSLVLGDVAWLVSSGEYGLEAVVSAIPRIRPISAVWPSPPRRGHRRPGRHRDRRRPGTTACASSMGTTRPSRRHHLHELADPVRGWTLVGSMLFVADGESGLEILDMSDPAVPAPISRGGLPGAGRSMTWRSATGSRSWQMFRGTCTSSVSRIPGPRDCSGAFAYPNLPGGSRLTAIWLP